jgi:ferredoxin/coenzyme F420-reducing hydrogenase delta subunit
MRNTKPAAEVLKDKNPAVDWDTRLNAPSRKFLAGLERLSLAVEKPLERLVGDPRFNPLYHTGTITVFLLLVILLTGIYLFLFYPFGFTVSYEAVARIESNLVGRVIRALHRYASDAAVIAALLHGWRTFFQDRFRGPRWLAWLTGMGMAAAVWIIGVTGYWLIWDSNVQLINQTLFDMFNSFAGGTRFLVQFIITATAETDWIFMLLVLAVHLGLSILTGLFLWWHFKRLKRAKWFPPRYAIFVLGGILLLTAILFPIGMLPPANPTLLPGRAPLDLFYLAYIPAALRQPPVFWSVSLVLMAAISALPWLMRRRKPLEPVQLTLDRCDGCTLCERDCPYMAIRMTERTDGKHHKFQAEIDPKLCVSCGVCIGSCPENALSFGSLPLDLLWEQTIQRVSEQKNGPVKVVFTCERHAQSGAKPGLASKSGTLIIPLTCIAMAHPSLPAQALQAGASEVQFIGCPPEDCANREGNLWMQQRLTGERLPKLKPGFADKIHTSWVAPTDFLRAARQSSRNPATAYGPAPFPKHTRPILALTGLFAITAVIVLSLNKWTFQPFAADSATLAVTLQHRSGYPIKGIAAQTDPDLSLDTPTRLTLTVDSETLLDETYPMTGSGFSYAAYAFEQIPVSTGEHHITLTIFDRPAPSIGQVIFDKSVTFDPRQVVNLQFKDDNLGGDPLRGESLYYETSVGTNAGCRLCHSLDPDVVLVGPSFAGIAIRAASRVPGLSAEEYIRQSILEPNAYVVPGFPAGQMVQNLGDVLSDEQVDDLVAFLMTFK